MDKFKFVFDNYNNSSYISSILIALFYNKRLSIELDKALSDPVNIYIQKFIKFNIINKMLEGKTIKYNIVKDFLLILTNNKFNLNERNIYLFYEYLIKIFELEEIKFKKKSLIKNNIIEEQKIKYIDLYLDNSLKNNNIKNLLDNWILNNNNKSKNKSQTNLDIRKIINVPKIISIKVNRENNNKFINIDLIINKKICLFNFSRNYSLEKMRWNVSAIICRNINVKDNYYTVLIKNNKWLLFNDLNIPCIEEISMSNNLITNKIKKECYLIIYIIDDKN